MVYATLIGCIVCAWAFLSLLGGERSRRVIELKNSMPSNPPTAGEPREPNPAASSKSNPHAARH